MTSAEIPLTGGNASSFVVRVGETVRKPWTPPSGSVQRLLTHLRAAVGDLVPEPRGRDDGGRQILEFVPGAEAMMQLPMTGSDVERVGASIRELHEASASFVRSDADVWETAMRRPGDEIIGHNDLAPWNLIRGGGRWAFIDWDGAGPTTRIADLAYAARAFAQLDHEHELDGSILLLRAVLRGYGAEPEERARVVPAMVERTEAMRDLLTESRTSGAEPWASMAADGHGGYWSNAAAHVRRHRETIARAVR
ncbi:phosphotransferase [Humibacter albus]|uniref:phosphotransferase n=1 Tax=Humibacter albus TaxID=427754 RepID=UPI0004001726|nr:phosphotransferase [Humibacter albus]